MTKEQALKKLRSTELHWSSISSFRYSKTRWFENYMLGKRQTSPQLTFGSYIDLKLQKDPTFLPTVPRYERMQHCMKGVKFGKLTLGGTPDGIDVNRKQKVLADFKTGVVAWDHKRTRETGQLLMYALLLYLTEGLKPEDFVYRIHWLRTEKEIKSIKTTIRFPKDMIPQTFECKHTMREVLAFGSYINKTFAEMEQFVATYKL